MRDLHSISLYLYLLSFFGVCCFVEVVGGWVGVGFITVHITIFYNLLPSLSCCFPCIFFLHVIACSDGVFLKSSQVLILSEVVKVETKPQLHKNARAHCIKTSAVLFFNSP